MAQSAWAVEYTVCFSAGGWYYSPSECLGYDTDVEIPLMVKHWEMQSTPSLPLLPGPFRPGVVAPDRVQSMSQIELNCVLTLNWIVFNRSVYMYKTVVFHFINRDNGFKLTKERSRRYPAQTITDADYADDIALLAYTSDQAETLLHSLEQAAAGMGLHVNAH